MVENIKCEFSDPELYDGDAPTSTDQEFEFSAVNCSTTVLMKKENATTGAEFYLSETINYGDALIVGFLLLFLIFGIVKFFLRTIIPKMVDFKRH